MSSTAHIRWAPVRSTHAPPREPRRRPSFIGRTLAAQAGPSSNPIEETFTTICKIHTLPSPPSTPPGYDSFQEECERSLVRTKKLLEEESRKDMERMNEDEMWIRLARLIERPPLVSVVGESEHEGPSSSLIPSHGSLSFLKQGLDINSLQPLDEPDFRARFQRYRASRRRYRYSTEDRVITAQYTA